MNRTIVLDSTPLALFVQKRDYRLAEECRAGFEPGGFVVVTSNIRHLAQFVPAEEWATI